MFTVKKKLNIVELKRLARAMVQAVYYRPLTTALQFRCQPVLVRFVVDKWHWDRIFSEHLFFSLSVSFDKCSTLIYILLLLSQEGKTEDYELSDKAKFFRVPCTYTLFISVPMVMQGWEVQGKTGI